MGRIIIFLTILTGFFITFSVFTGGVSAQSSSTWRTRVGSPTVQASSCPIPGGIPSCGSRNEPRGGCGHCDAAYTAAYGCGYESLAYALDVPGSYGADIFLPTIGGNNIRWTFLDQPKNVNRTAIQRYGGTDEKTGEQYMIKFHHSAPRSGGGTKLSGEVGARICDSPCDVGTGPHVHIEFARVNGDGSYSWIDAPLFFCGG
jgi:hypothetical protein